MKVEDLIDIWLMLLERNPRDVLVSHEVAEKTLLALTRMGALIDILHDVTGISELLS